MSTRFLIAALFLIPIAIGGFMTGDQEPVNLLEGVLMIGGFLGAAGTLFFMNNSKWNKKLWKW